MSNFARAGLLVAAVALAGCTQSEMKNLAAAHAGKSIPAKLVAAMNSKGMTRTSPVMARIFKEEGKLEIWKQKANGRYDVLATYDICKISGKLGPKFVEGDRQAPEGFYTVRPAQMNPNSSYHLSFNIGYPNAYDRANGRTGSNLMVHGACSSSGCYSMTDPQIEEIYAVAREAFKGGQSEFQIQAFPFRMTAANMARYKDDPNYAFWTMLKEGYDHFEITKVPPKVDVCDKRYVFNAVPEGEASFSPAAACPAFSQPETLRTAYQSYQSSFEAAFSTAVGSKVAAPKPTIAGLKEAGIVSEWSRKRARGERVPIEPPSVTHDGKVEITSRMGRIDSPAGRKMAAADAAAEAKKRAAEEKAAAKARAKAEKEAAKLAAAEAKLAPEQAAAAPPEPVEMPVGAIQAVPEKPGMLGGMRKRLGNIFGG